MGDLQGLLASLDGDPLARGSEFERVCKWFLENDPRYAAQLEKVWLWRDWPDRWGVDAGIDLVARTREGHLWAIQAKAYDPASTVTKADLDTFLSESSRPRFTYRLLVATTDRLSGTARRTLIGQEKPVGHLLLSDLLDSQVEWPESPADLRPQRAPLKTPHPHQARAVRDVVACLSTSPRARLVMACGTGKTLTALFAAEEMASTRTLVLVPSLSLLAQTLGEWLANSAGPMEFKAVCSDATVAAEDRDAPVATTSDLGLPVTTDPDDIAAFLRRDGGAVHRVVFATYQSSQRIAEAMTHEGVPAFDLAIADEAHRCTGPITGDFATILDADAIRARHRVFMTATPRYFTGRIIRQAREADFEVASMDDETTFGPLAHRLTFGQAIQDELLTDYQVAIIGVDDAMYRDWVERGELVTPDGVKVTDARTLAGHIGLAKAMRDFELRQTITFHNRVQRASDFAHAIPAVISWMPAGMRPEGSLDARHVSGLMSAGQRRALLKRLTVPQADRTLLANARCLTEGIDVPSLDGVAFIDPRRSEIDVVQAVGRAIRKAPDKKAGTIILPVFISDSDDPNIALNDSAFKTVWEVLNAMRAHDEELAEWLDALRRNLGRNEGSPVDLPGKIILDLPVRVSPDFAEAVKVRLVEQTTASWEASFAVLMGFVEREGHAQVRQHHREGDIRLGTWVSNQRSLRGRNALLEERRCRLEALPGWTWDAQEDQWERGFQALTAYIEREGHARVPYPHSEGTLKLGQWVTFQRSRVKRLPPDRRQRLESLPGWTWDELQARWEEGLAALTAYIEREGHARVPYSHSEGTFKLGQWVAFQRSRLQQMPPDRRRQLESLPGWTWDVNNARWVSGFAALTTFVAREGHSRVPQAHIEGGFRLGLWVTSQRGQGDDLPPDRRERLEALPGWTWHRVETRWEEAFAALSSYVARVGNARVPSGHVEGAHRLGRWVANQRALRDRMPDDRRARLEALPGWVWSEKDARWEEAFAALVAYVESNGDARVPARSIQGTIKLGMWVRIQREYREQLSPERRASLEALPGWTWDVLDAQWEQALAALTRYVRRVGNARVPVSHREGTFDLGRWVANQRAVRDRMPEIRRQQLESLPGWTWSALDALWEAGFAALLAYVQSEGHARVPQHHKEGDIQLGTWVGTQRRGRNQLSAERRERLESLPGWTWDVRAAQWEENFATLITYVEREGHAHVPQHYREGEVGLGQWVSTQRSRRGQLSEERRERLEALPGWVWRSSAVPTRR